MIQAGVVLDLIDISLLNYLSFLEQHKIVFRRHFLCFQLLVCYSVNY